MTANTNTNAPEFLLTGAKAGDALKRGDTAMTSGEALSVVALHAALTSGYEMQFITARTKDDSDDAVTFTLATYGNNIVSENGKNDSKAISARKAALYADLFGLATFTAAQDGVIARALVSAEYLANNNAVPTLNKKGQLVVPYSLIAPALKPDASDNDKTTYEAMKDKPVVLDGKKGTSLRELRNKAVAAQPRKTRKAKSGTGGTANVEQDFRTAMKFLLSIVQTANNSDESPVAFKDDDMNTLNMLAAGIASLTGEEIEVSNKRAA